MNLTREQIMQMPAGHEMDHLVAERVMGWTFVHQVPVEQWHDNRGNRVANVFWSPSTNIAEAWDVMARIKEIAGADTSRVWIRFCDEIAGPEGAYDGFLNLWHVSPLTICKAALVTVVDIPTE